MLKNKMTNKPLSEKIQSHGNGITKYCTTKDIAQAIKKLKEEAKQIHQGKPYYYSSEKKMQFILDKIDKIMGEFKDE